MESIFPLVLVALATHAYGITTKMNGTQPSSRFFLTGTILTASQNPDDGRFYIFSNPSNPNEAEEIEFNGNETELPSSFSCDTTTKILVHGFTGNGLEQTSFPGNVKKEYLKKYPETGYNILTVDWGLLAKCANPLSYLCYREAALKNVRIVGRRIGEFIVLLRDNCGEEYLDSVHILGHSLGAHVSGYAGYTVIKLTGNRIGRLTGLDPAGPLFVKDAPPPAPRMLRASDANFTDVYHTDSRRQGTACAVGHLDLFVNGGFNPQPNCAFAADLRSYAACSHARSHEYYANSIAFGDPATNSSATVQACRVLPVHCVAITPDLISEDGCDQGIVYGEYLEPGSVMGTYCVGYPSPRTCFQGRSSLLWPFINSL